MVPSVITPLLLAEGASGGGLTDVSRVLFVFTLILFALFVFVLGRFGWKPLLRLIEEREEGIRNAVDEAHKANAEAQALLARHQELLRNTGREREEILKRAIQEADQIRTDLVTRAKGEADGLIARAKDEISRETRRALGEMHSRVADLAIEAASKIVTSSMSPEAQRKLVEEFIKDLPQAR
jgi:F-type H+-transporting ATPase subunit b